MALKIRLTRGGAKKRPFYRIVVAESRSPRDGRYIERLGTYNPMLTKDHPDRVTLNVERIKHWLGTGAAPSDRVAGFLGAAGIIAVPARGNNLLKAKPKAKAQERLKANADAAKAADDAAKAAEEEAKAAAAAPAEEAPAEEAPAEEAPAAEAADAAEAKEAS